MSKIEYCDACSSRFKIVYRTNVYCLKNDSISGETIWTWFRSISEKNWIERYQKFVKNLNERYKYKFKKKIKLLFDKYFICSNPNCGKVVEDGYWRNEDAIRSTSFQSLRR